MENISMMIGINLKKLRNKTKYSQQDVADILEIDRVTYANWENETTDVKSQYIPKLADFFGVTIQDLFAQDPKNNIVNNNFDNRDNAIGQKDIQQGIIINISDSEIAKELADQIKDLIQNIKDT